MENKIAPSSMAIAYETYKPGDIIFSEGEIGYHFYIVESGRVQIFREGVAASQVKSGPVEVEVATVEEGESFGEFALLAKQPRSASAKALTACRIAKISPEGYEQLLSELPTWAISMMRSFAQRMKHSNELLQQIPQFISRPKS